MTARTTIERRKFLIGGVSALASLAGAPGWIRAAFAEEGPCETSLRGVASLGAAFRLAHAAKKRLLVLVIPSKDDEKYSRGELFGAWLNHSTDAQLAPLSLCGLTCATMADLRRLVPNAPEGEPLMVLLDPSALGNAPLAVDPPVPALVADAPEWVGGGPQGFAESMRERDARTNAGWQNRVAVISRAVRIAVAPGARFPNEASLADEVRSRWVKGKVPGSHWAQSSGCGVTIEDVESDFLVACGMGYVPEKAKRFLYLFAVTPHARRAHSP